MPVPDPRGNAGASDLWPNSRTLFEPARSHYALAWSCSAQVLAEFFGLGAADGLQARCMKQVEPLPFHSRP
jgi:hypothetical protein